MKRSPVVRPLFLLAAAAALAVAVSAALLKALPKSLWVGGAKN